jgi:polyhydroxyalkanoate synthesis regulator protein
MFSAMEEQTRKNIAMFNQALGMFNPFVPGAQPQAGAQAKPQDEQPVQDAPAGDLDDMKRQLSEMQRQIESLTRKG